jgi:hypothetical protein
MKALAFASFFALAAAALAQTNYQLPAQACVKISNCILYGPNEQFSLWTTAPSTGTLGWSIFTVYDWSSGVAVPVDTYNCNNSSYSTVPAGTAITLSQICSGTSVEGKTFQLSYTLNAYSYKARSGGGKGGGGAGTRWFVTGGTVTLTTN